MASFRVLRLLRNYCDPFLPKDDSSSAEGLRLFLSCLRRCESPAGPWDPARRAQIHARLHARHSAELASQIDERIDERVFAEQICDARNAAGILVNRFHGLRRKNRSSVSAAE